MITDPIADMLTRIRNGYLARKERVLVPYSGFKHNIAEILVKLNYLEKLEVEKEDKVAKNLMITLKYKNGVPAVTAIDRVSKPGLRIYGGKKKLPRVLSGMGEALVTTSQGLMTAGEARKKNLGGEVILKVY